MALEKYNIFLNADIPNAPADVYWELWEYRKKHNIYGYLSGYTPKELPANYYQKLAQAIIDNIMEMLRRDNLTYEKLKIYIRKERLFNQVRFIFFSSDGWIDDSEIIAKPENYEFLIAIHAMVTDVTATALRDCGCYVSDDIHYDNNVLPSGDMFTDAMTFHTEFLQWKQDIITHQ